jgi:hypothetical protein
VTEGMGDEQRFLALVAEMEAKDARLSSAQAAIVVAAEQGIASDSRSFAKVFGIAHALVLRDVTMLVEAGLLQLVKQDARTLRTYYAVKPS